MIAGLTARQRRPDVDAGRSDVDVFAPARIPVADQILVDRRDRDDRLVGGGVAWRGCGAVIANGRNKYDVLR